MATPAEITIESDWSVLLDKSENSVNVVVQVDNEEIYLLYDFVTKTEAEQLVIATEQHGYGHTNYPKDYRGNLRLLADDEALSVELCKRIKSTLLDKGIIPETLTENGHEYVFAGLNRRWRYAKYYPGDKFASHIDGCYEDDEGVVKSMFTVNIYLNDTFTGGNTTFDFNNYDDPDADLDYQDSSKMYPVEPVTGLCLVFRQPDTKEYVHEGTEVKTGVKYLMRTDIMYRRITGRT